MQALMFFCAFVFLGAAYLMFSFLVCVGNVVVGVALKLSDYDVEALWVAWGVVHGV